MARRHERGSEAVGLLKRRDAQTVLVQRRRDGFQTQKAQGVSVRFKPGIFDGDAVSFVEEHLAAEGEPLLNARRDDHFFGFAENAAGLTDIVRDRLSKGGKASGKTVAVVLPRAL